MRSIAVLAAVCLFSTVCYCQTSPNVPAPNAAASAQPIAAPSTTASLPAVPAPVAIAAQPTPPPQAQSPSITDEAVRTLFAERERDMYKQIAETTRATVENTKWIFTSMLTAFGILLGLATVVAFKETRRYKEAVANAQQAAKNAHDCEQEAKGILANIDTQTKAQLEAIEKRGEEKIKDLITKAEKQRKISELWSDGHRLRNEEKYKDACEKWRQVIDLKPDEYRAYGILCATLAEWAERNNDDTLFKEAHNVYDQLKSLAAENSEEDVIRHNQTYAGVWLATAYSHCQRMSEAKALLAEVEPFVRDLPSEESRQELVEWIAKLRQKPGMQ